MHINIQGLSSKFESLKMLLSTLLDAKVIIDCIMLCETFINDLNAQLYNTAGYNFTYNNRQNMMRGGVALYIRNNIQYKIREDLGIFIEGEFESVFVETMGNTPSTIIGEIYRVPNTNPTVSIDRYRSIIDRLYNNGSVIIGTDQN